MPVFINVRSFALPPAIGYNFLRATKPFPRFLNASLFGTIKGQIRLLPRINEEGEIQRNGQRLVASEALLIPGIE